MSSPSSSSSPAVQVLARVRPPAPGVGPSDTCVLLGPGTTSALDVVVGGTGTTTVATAAAASATAATATTPGAYSSARSGTSSSTGPSSAPDRIRFAFHGVFPPEATQEAVFERLRPTFARAIAGVGVDGAGAAVLAYGQTGSGKTYSMLGGGSYRTRGVVQRCLSMLFDELEEGAAATSTTASSSSSSARVVPFTVRLAAYQVYDERVFDLLDPAQRGLPLEQWAPIPVQERNGAVHLRGLRVYEVAREADALALLALAQVARLTASTPMNRASSRSHAVFALTLTPVKGGLGGAGEGGAAGVGPESRITLVDLAGSERIFKTGVGVASSGAGLGPRRTSAGGPSYTSAAALASAASARASEGVSINLSLHYLEQCIVALGERRNAQAHAHLAAAAAYQAATSSPSSVGSGGGAALSSLLSPSASFSGGGHIPFRNSALTSVLRDVLSGGCRTAFLTTLNPEAAYAGETASTCRFAARCARMVLVAEPRAPPAGADERERERASLSRALRDKQQLAAQLEEALRRATAAEGALRLRHADAPSVLSDGERAEVHEAVAAVLALAPPGVPLAAAAAQFGQEKLPGWASSASSSSGSGGPPQHPFPARTLPQALYALDLMQQALGTAVSAAAALAANTGTHTTPGGAAAAAAGSPARTPTRRAAAPAVSPPVQPILAAASLAQQSPVVAARAAPERSRDAATSPPPRRQGGEESGSGAAARGDSDDAGPRVAAAPQPAAVFSTTPALVLKKPSLVPDEPAAAAASVVPQAVAVVRPQSLAPVSSPSTAPPRVVVVQDLRHELETAAQSDDRIITRSSESLTPGSVSPPVSPTGKGAAPGPTHVPAAPAEHPAAAATPRPVSPPPSSPSPAIPPPDHLALLVAGGTFVKYPRSAFAKPALRRVWLDGAHGTVCWRTAARDGGDADGDAHGDLPASDLLEVLPGQQTPAFKRFKVQPREAGACLSLVFRGRTVDLRVDPAGADPLLGTLEAQKAVRDQWVAALEWLRGRNAGGAGKGGGREL
jgi:hypothetical protein